VPPTEPASQLSLRDQLRVVRRRKLVIILTMVVVTGTAVALSSTKPKIYEGTAEVLLEARTGETLFQNVAQRAVSVQTEIRVLKSAPVQAAVRNELGVAPKVWASPIPDTSLFQVKARSRDPARAAAIANSYVESYITYRQTEAVRGLVEAGAAVQKQADALQTEIDSLTAKAIAAGAKGEQAYGPRRDQLVTQQVILKQRLDQLQADATLKSGGAQLVTPAVAEATPISPKPKRDGVLGAGVGLVLGHGLAVLFEHLDDTIKLKEDFERAAHGLPVLGLIPVVSAWKRRGEPMVISQVDPSSPASEAYRTLRTSISFLGIDHAMRTLQVTSPGASDGKSTTLANLAVALAQTGQRVVLVCCDLRRPRIHEFFGLSNEVGFTNVLLGDTPLNRALQQVPGEDNLKLLASGPKPPNPSELLSSSRTIEILVALQAHADMVLLDCPPVLPVTDAAVLSARVDATLLVATARKTTQREVARAVEILRQVEAPLVGTVLNGVAGDDASYGGYGHRYYQADPPPKVARAGRRS
jgi:capsular exopolysaccharide synthesis family protein